MAKSFEVYTILRSDVPGQWDSVIERTGVYKYRVTYGGQIDNVTTIEQALKLHNENVLHALGCAGELDG